MNDHTAPTKRCKKCGVEYPATAEYFYKCGTGNRYLRGECKKCRDAYVQEWCDRNRPKRRKIVKRYDDANRDKQRAWRLQNADYLKSYFRRYYAENRDRVQAKNRAWYEANRDRVRKYKQMWQKVNRHKIVASGNRRRALIRASKGNHTPEDIALIYTSQRGLCWWCGCNVGETYHVDHRIPLSRGGSNAPDNLVISCPACNQSKYNKLPHEWNGRLL